jgi:hypothetical protein
MEYDFSINNLDLLDKNIEHLQDNDVLLYKHNLQGYDILLGYMCIKVSSFQLDEIYYIKENLLNKYFGYELKVENFIFDLLFKNKNYSLKEYESVLEFLTPSQYQVADEIKTLGFFLVHKEKELYDSEDLFWAIHNLKDEPLSFSIIVNNNTIHNLYIRPHISELGGLGLLEDINNVKFL